MQLFALASIVVLVIAGIWGGSAALFITNSQTAEATVTFVTKQYRGTMNQGETRDRRVLFRPTFEFQTGAGATVSATPSSGSFEWDFEIGERIPVRYQADNPEAAIPDTWISTWMWPLGLGVVGLGLAVGAVINAWVPQDATTQQ
jgi:hypothetical protein